MKNSAQAFHESLLTTLFCSVILLLAVACHAGGYLHWESSAFLLNYTAERPLLNIIFDPHRNDWGLYQCRELSYFFDWIDSQIVYAFLKAKLLWFISPSAIVFSLLTIWFQQYAGRMLFPRLSGIFFTLHGAAMALLPALSESIYFRSSKFLTLAGMTFLIFGTALRFIKSKSVFAGTLSSGIAAAICVFSDRQGIFFVTAFTGIIAVMQFFHKRCGAEKILRLCTAVILSGIVANLWVVPFIVNFLNHYLPDFSYQGDFAVNGSILQSGFRFVSANCGFFLTGCSNVYVSSVAGTLLITAMCLLFLRRHHLPPWLFPGTVCTIIVCCGLMVLRHPPLLHDDVIFSNYFLPSAAVLSFFYFTALDHLPEKIKKWCFLLPLLAICLRLYPYLYPEMLFRDDKYQKVYQDATIKLKYAIENPDCDHRLLTLPYRMEMLLEKLKRR